MDRIPTDKLKADIEAYARRFRLRFTQEEMKDYWSLRLKDRDAGNIAARHMLRLHTDRNYNTLRYLERASAAVFYRKKDIGTIQAWEEEHGLRLFAPEEAEALARTFEAPEQETMDRLTAGLERLRGNGDVTGYELWAEGGAIRLEYAVRADRAELGFFGAENESSRVSGIIDTLIHDLGLSYFLDEWTTWDVNDTDYDEHFFHEAIIAEGAHFNSPEEWDVCVRYIARNYHLEEDE